MPRGLAGLMLAGLFAAGLGSLNSAINAMAATTINDFYMPAVKGKSERHYLLASRLATVAWGVGIAGFAVVCIFWKRANRFWKVVLALYNPLMCWTLAYTGEHYV